MTPCQNKCAHAGERSIGGGVMWGCILKKIRFGCESEWKAGTNQPKKCSEWVKL